MGFQRKDEAERVYQVLPLRFQKYGLRAGKIKGRRNPTLAQTVLLPQQDLLRIAQEAMSNGVRHAKPTVISVNLRCNPTDIVLEVSDNGFGMADSQAASREGFGFSNMRARAENIGAQLKVRTASGRGTTIVVQVPMNF
jgi:nitrate/nitrite-specific signal transduction histidine kinase